MRKVADIPDTLATIFRRADEERRPTNDVAAAMAMERIGKADLS